MKRGYFNQNFSNKFVTATYLAVAVSCSKLKSTHTFTIICEKFSLSGHNGFGIVSEKMVETYVCELVLF